MQRRKEKMLLKNTLQSYGVITKLLHWSIAMLTLALFGLGVWMVELGYYDNWYQRAPTLHEGVGALLFILLAIRIFWRWSNIHPDPLKTHRPWEKIAARLTHILLNMLLLAITISGYLIVTAKGAPLNVLNLFNIPASVTDIMNQADKAGELHLWLAWALIILVSIHALAALKHHFIDKDSTLNRMLGK